MAHASDFEAAGASYDDDRASGYISSQSVSFQTDRLFTGKGRKSSFKLGLTERQTTLKDDKSIFVREQLDGNPTTDDQAATISYDQGIVVGTRLGVVAGLQQSKIGNSQFFGVRAGQWWLRETLETTIEVRHVSADQRPITGTDFDGSKISLPENLEGNNLALGLTSFVTTSTIVVLNTSYTTRSDRPPASAIAAELRQFIAPTKSALHVGVSHYENVGTIEPVTFTGSVVAHSAFAEWHQRFLDRFIGTGGYRYYVEEERPRAETIETKQLGSDHFYGTLRWRAGTEPWTQEGPEVYVFASRYTTNEPLAGLLLGLGGKFVW